MSPWLDLVYSAPSRRVLAVFWARLKNDHHTLLNSLYWLTVREPNCA